MGSRGRARGAGRGERPAPTAPGEHTGWPGAMEYLGVRLGQRGERSGGGRKPSRDSHGVTHGLAWRRGVPGGAAGPEGSQGRRGTGRARAQHTPQRKQARNNTRAAARAPPHKRARQANTRRHAHAHKRDNATPAGTRAHTRTRTHTHTHTHKDRQTQNTHRCVWACSRRRSPLHPPRFNKASKKPPTQPPLIQPLHCKVRADMRQKKKAKKELDRFMNDE